MAVTRTRRSSARDQDKDKDTVKEESQDAAEVRRKPGPRVSRARGRPSPVVKAKLENEETAAAAATVSGKRRFGPNIRRDRPRRPSSSATTQEAAPVLSAGNQDASANDDTEATQATALDTSAGQSLPTPTTSQQGTPISTPRSHRMRPPRILSASSTPRPASQSEKEAAPSTISTPQSSIRKGKSSFAPKDATGRQAKTVAFGDNEYVTFDRSAPSSTPMLKEGHLPSRSLTSSLGKRKNSASPGDEAEGARPADESEDAEHASDGMALVPVPGLHRDAVPLSNYREKKKNLLKAIRNRKGPHLMKDYIIFNPKTRPMQDVVEKRLLTRQRRRAARMASSEISSVTATRESGGELESPQTSAVGSPAPVESPVDSPRNDVPADKATAGRSGSSIFAPQVRVSETGDIVLDPQSLSVNASELREREREALTRRVVQEYGNHVTYWSFANRATVDKWSKEETDLFYYGLSTCGTDFSLIQRIMPKRNRKQIKAKFIREEKYNRDKVEEALKMRKPLTTSGYTDLLVHEDTA
eukprot:Clim_evm33s142 gene=Clim_evmTU33s142